MTLDELIVSLQEWKKVVPGTTPVRVSNNDYGEAACFSPDGSDHVPGTAEDGPGGIILIYNSAWNERMDSYNYLFEEEDETHSKDNS